MFDRRATALQVVRVFCAALPQAHASPGGIDCDNPQGLPIDFNVAWQTQIKPIFNEVEGEPPIPRDSIFRDGVESLR